jgi:hypothetical protein
VCQAERVPLSLCNSEPAARSKANQPDDVRRPCCSRPTFQIWPHAVQRQYVETFTALLVVVTSTELQKGQAVGATIASIAWVYTRIASQRCGSCSDNSAKRSRSIETWRAPISASHNSALYHKREFTVGSPVRPSLVGPSQQQAVEITPSIEFRECVRSALFQTEHQDASPTQ